ncbi:MAG: hypothetical protein ABIN58_05290, partial [candidate division WOR-3 bacterium]
MQFVKNRVYVVTCPDLFEGPTLAFEPHYIFDGARSILWNDGERDHLTGASEVIHEDEQSITVRSGNFVWTFMEMTMELWQELRPKIIGGDDLHFKRVEE